MRAVLLTVQAMGVAAVVAGVALVSVPAAMIVGGLALAMIVERNA